MKDKRKDTFAIGRITAGTGGIKNVNIGGKTFDYQAPPVNINFNVNDRVFVLFLDDDTPAIIGKSGYTTPL